MKNVTKIVGSVVAAATLALQNVQVQAAVGNFLHSHPNVSAVLVGLTTILALVHNPNQNPSN